VKSVGDAFEERAALWLQESGLHLLARNFRYPGGEVDIVALDGECLVFLEVRRRSNPRFAGAAASVDWRKQQRILRAAQVFLQRHPQWSALPCRFDVVAFEPRQSAPDSAPLWIRAAFTT
jgi:putative endonuclease